MNIIYFLQRADGDIKIGITNHYPSRLNQLNEKYGELKLLGMIEGGRAIEKWLHSRLNDYRIHRTEFFITTPKLLRFIRLFATLDVNHAIAEQNKIRMKHRRAITPRVAQRLRTEPIQCTLPPEMKAAAEMSAKEDHIPLAEFMRRCLEAEFKRRKLDWTKMEVEDKE